MSERETILIVDFGAQYNQLIARRVREEKVYSMIVPYDVSVERIKAIDPKGIIFTGGPSSVHEAGAPKSDPGIYDLGIPVLGICYGAQLMVEQLGGHTEKATVREYGKKNLHIVKQTPFLKDVKEGSVCWMSHTNYIKAIPEGFGVTANTDTCPVAAMENPDAGLYAVQYHPEVEHTQCGREILHNFLYNICGCEGTWTMANFIDEQVTAIRERVGDRKVLCALSGGVDSSVASTLVHRAIGQQLTCIFVDHGLLRKDEGDQVEAVFKDRFQMNFLRVNCADRFLDKLAGVTDPERKRKIIGEEFIRVFEEESGKLKDMDYLLQGTIYPDVIESGSKNAAVIKSHHNVGGLPDDVDFELIEPLRNLFKDEVRTLGEELGLDHDLVWRQPFPGPGLAIRVMGEVTRDKLAILREADYVFRDEIAKAGLDSQIGSISPYCPATEASASWATNAPTTIPSACAPSPPWTA